MADAAVGAVAGRSTPGKLCRALVLLAILSSTACGRVLSDAPPTGLPPAPPTPTPTPTDAPTTLPTASPTTARLSPTEPPAASSGDPAGRIGLGPGFVNNFNHALVRSAEDRLYILVNNDSPANAGSGPGYLRMLRATTTGRPSAFEERDTTHRPTSGGVRSAIGDAAIAIDGQGLIHVVYHDRDGSGAGTPQIKYVTFSTADDSWSAPEVVVSAATDYPRGYGGVALALDGSGRPDLAYVQDRQLYVRRRESGQWSTPLQVSDTEHEAQHPSIAHGPDDRLHIAWYRRGGDELRYRSRSATDQLDPASQSIARYMPDSLNDVDQGPALTLTADGTLWCAYLDGQQHVRVRRFSAAGWLDAGPDEPIYAHSPTIAAVENDLWLLLGHDDQTDYAALHRPAGGGWGQKQVLEVGTFDGSANARWSWFFNGRSSILDTLFFDEGSAPNFQAQLYYRAIETAVAGTPPAGPCPAREADPSLAALCGYLPLVYAVRQRLAR